MLFEVAQTVNANGIAVNNLEINVCLHFVANSPLALFLLYVNGLSAATLSSRPSVDCAR